MKRRDFLATAGVAPAAALLAKTNNGEIKVGDVVTYKKTSLRKGRQTEIDIVGKVIRIEGRDPYVSCTRDGPQLKQNETRTYFVECDTDVFRRIGYLTKREYRNFMRSLIKAYDLYKDAPKDIIEKIKSGHVEGRAVDQYGFQYVFCSVDPRIHDRMWVNENNYKFVRMEYTPRRKNIKKWWVVKCKSMWKIR